MTFCASCGRQRDGGSRFCLGCGAEFTDTVQVSTGQEPPAAEQTDPFASWYKKEPPASHTQEATVWGLDADANSQPTRTVAGTPVQPPAVPPPSGFTPGPQAASPGRGNRGRGLFATVAVVVVLAAGGGAYALVSSLGKHGAPTPSGTTAAGNSVSASTGPGSTGPASTAPSPAQSLVAVSQGVTSSAVPQVETLLSHYFHGINTHNYQEYASTLNPQQLADEPQSKFDSGFATTSDSAMTLTSLSGNGSGGQVATVTFTSRQSPADSVDKSACNAWTLNFYLVPQSSSTGGNYLIGPAPSGYQPTFSDC